MDEVDCALSTHFGCYLSVMQLSSRSRGSDFGFRAAGGASSFWNRQSWLLKPTGTSMSAWEWTKLIALSVLISAVIYLSCSCHQEAGGRTSDSGLQGEHRRSGIGKAGC